VLLLVHHEAKATALARLPVLNHGRKYDAAIGLEGIAEGGRLGAEGEVAHEELETLFGVRGRERRKGWVS